MDLIKINLLPYREQREAKQKQKFQGIMLVGGLLGVAVAGAIYMYLNEAIESQEARNTELNNGIKALEGDLATIKELELRKHNLNERKFKVEELDNKRFEGARILDTLNLKNVVYPGSYLLALKGADSKGSKQGNEYMIEGKAVDDTKISALMSALPSSGLFDVPELVEIKKEDDGQRFVLKTVLVPQMRKPAPKPKTVTAPAAAASAPAAPATK